MAYDEDLAARIRELVRVDPEESDALLASTPAELMEHGWSYPAAKEHMGDWYRAPTGMGAGVTRSASRMLKRSRARLIRGRSFLALGG